MIAKMILHGLIAAAMISGAAAFYASSVGTAAPARAEAGHHDD